MRCEVLAVGTELLLGQVVDTNSAWIGEHLALAGIDCHLQTKVGDNLGRIVECLRSALERSDAVICCGGLGPTQDDITREAIAEVMGVALRRDPALIEVIRSMFSARGREMAESNLRQADVPDGATVIPQTRGTAPGLVCPVGDRVVYAVPGVPYEMEDMLQRAVLPDLQARAGTTATILSRTLRTWGLAESTLAEVVAPRVEALDRAGGNPTIAFLASGIEGIKVRVTAKAATAATARDLLDREEAELRALLGPLVFGVDEATMEDAVARLLVQQGLTLGLAESLTGGLVASRLVNVVGSSGWFRGSVVAYSPEVKFGRQARARGQRAGGPADGRGGQAGAGVRRGPVGHRGGRPGRAGRPAPGDGVHRPGPARAACGGPGRAPARRQGPGAPVLRHLCPRSPAPAPARTGRRHPG